MARREAITFGLGLHVPVPRGRPQAVAVVPRGPMALLRFALPRTTAGTVAVFDERGALVRMVLSGELAAGEHACAWDGRDEHDAAVLPGAYMVRLEVAGRVLTSRRVLID